MKNPRFITIEGVDGAGKSSHVEPLAQSMRAQGLEVVLTREPGGTPLGEQLREILLHQAMDPATETMLMFASRKELLAQVIRPALARGAVVLCDRFSDSSWAYQGGGKGVSSQLLTQLEEITHPDLKPGLTLLFDLPVHMSLQRLRGTGKTADKFESMGEQYFSDVRQTYLMRAKENQGIKILDSSAPIEVVREQALTQLGLHLVAQGLMGPGRKKPHP